jgi:hypothetical protein
MRTKIFVLTLIVLLFTGGCTSTGPADFSIYLLKNDIPASQITSLSSLEPADKPIIGINDIVTYHKDTHEIELTAEAFRRIAELPVPVSGKAFVACLDRRPVYSGAFWTPISSIAFNGVAIMKPMSGQNQTAIRISPGYPTEQFFHVPDPRNNEDIFNALQKAGKLKIDN